MERAAGRDVFAAGLQHLNCEVSPNLFSVGSKRHEADVRVAVVRLLCVYCELYEYRNNC